MNNLENEKINTENSSKENKNVSENVKENASEKEKITSEKNLNPSNAKRSGSSRRGSLKNQEYQVEVIKIKKICKVVKGGRRFRFSALVVSGNKKGKVGFGIAKAYEVPDAIKKAQKQANKNMFNVPIIGNQATISHEIIGQSGSSKILIKPAKEGTGIVAGGSIRILLELSGIKNIYTKALGSRNDLNMILATTQGLKNLKTADQVAFLRDKNVKDFKQSRK